MPSKIVQDSPAFLETEADSVLLVGTEVNDHEMITLAFFKNYPIIELDEKQNLHVTSIDKRRMASINMSMGTAKRFYEVLKQAMEQKR